MQGSRRFLVLTLALSALICLTSCSQNPKAEPAVKTLSEAEIEDQLRKALATRTDIPEIDSNQRKKLAPGEFVWQPENSPSGPVLVVVSIPQQLVYVYRNGVQIAVSTVSTGRKGNETPDGVFTILEKRQKHFSNLYNNAPMPNMERLTWDGIALHAGKLPGYPASHGCIRMPMKFSELLYSVTTKGTTVVISNQHTTAQILTHPGLFAPALPDGKLASDPSALPAGQYDWQPEKAPEGPVAVLLSSADKMMRVFRNGVLIGQAGLKILVAEQPLGSVVFTTLGPTDQPSTLAPGKPMLRWVAVGLPDKEGSQSALDVIHRLRISPEFSAKVYDLMIPGTTVMVTDLPSTEQTTTDPGFVVMASHESEKGQPKIIK